MRISSPRINKVNAQEKFSERENHLMLLLLCCDNDDDINILLLYPIMVYGAVCDMTTLN